MPAPPARRSCSASGVVEMAGLAQLLPPLADQQCGVARRAGRQVAGSDAVPLSADIGRCSHVLARVARTAWCTPGAGAAHAVKRPYAVTRVSAHLVSTAWIDGQGTCDRAQHVHQRGPRRRRPAPPDARTAPSSRPATNAAHGSTWTIAVMPDVAATATTDTAHTSTDGHGEHSDRTTAGTPRSSGRRCPRCPQCHRGGRVRHRTPSRHGRDPTRGARERRSGHLGEQPGRRVLGGRHLVSGRRRRVLRPPPRRSGGDRRRERPRQDHHGAVAAWDCCPKNVTRHAARPSSAPASWSGADQRVLRSIRGRQVAVIFQEPMTALNPVYTDRVPDRRDAARATRRWRPRPHVAGRSSCSTLVEIAEPERRVDSYPHQLSGGQRQRAMIAQALALRPHGADRRRARPRRSTSPCRPRSSKLLRRPARPHRFAASCSSPTTWVWSPTWRIASWSCSDGRIVETGTADSRCSSGPTTRTRSSCCEPCRTSASRSTR